VVAIIAKSKKAPKKIIWTISGILLRIAALTSLTWTTAAQETNVVNKGDHAAKMRIVRHI